MSVFLRKGKHGQVRVEDGAWSWGGTGRGKTGTKAWRRGAKSRSEQPLGPRSQALERTCTGNPTEATQDPAQEEFGLSGQSEKERTPKMCQALCGFCIYMPSSSPQQPSVEAYSSPILLRRKLRLRGIK